MTMVTRNPFDNRAEETVYIKSNGVCISKVNIVSSVGSAQLEIKKYLLLASPEALGSVHEPDAIFSAKYWVNPRKFPEIQM